MPTRHSLRAFPTRLLATDGDCHRKFDARLETIIIERGPLPMRRRAEVRRTTMKARQFPSLLRSDAIRPSRSGHFRHS